MHISYLFGDDRYKVKIKSENKTLPRPQIQNRNRKNCPS